MEVRSGQTFVFLDNGCECRKCLEEGREIFGLWQSKIGLWICRHLDRNRRTAQEKRQEIQKEGENNNIKSFA